MMKDSQTFIKALQEGDIHTICRVPKSDLHLHAGRSCRKSDLSKWLASEIPNPPDTGFASLDEMERWVDRYIKGRKSPEELWRKRIELMFLAAETDGVVLMEPDFTVRDVARVGGVDTFVDFISKVYDPYREHIVLQPCLSFRTRDEIEFMTEKAKKYLSRGWFCSIDLCNREGERPISYYKRLYEIAEYYGLTKKAHVGEFGSAEDVLEAVTVLKLDVVQHGISVAQNAEVMERLRDKKLMFNVCPESNIYLRIVPSYEQHPAASMVRAGLNITINTDDRLVFGQGVSGEFLKLFQSGNLSADELNQIRLNGLKNRGKVCENGS